MTGAGFSTTRSGSMSDVLRRYGIAAALPALAVLLRALLPFPEGAGIYELPLSAVVLSAWYGGRGPGLLASALSVIGAMYLLPPAFSFGVAREHVLPFSIFAALCLFLSEFAAGRRQAQHALHASEARFRTFVDHATDGFFLHDERLTIVDANRHACESLGYSREQMIGMHPRNFDAGLDDASIKRMAERVASGETVTFETLHRRKDGIVLPVEIRVRAFEQAGKRYHISLVRDISERKLAEETVRGKDNALQMARTELARVSRLTTLGELTTSIAHEVSQPLGAMMASAAAGTRWLAAEPPDILEARAALDNIAADGKRAREVIGRIRALTKRQVVRKDSVDLNHEILEVLAITGHELRSHDVVLRSELDDALPRVAADRVQLQQVLLNLILNAIDAMSGIEGRPRELTIGCRRDGSGVLVEVRDSGTGLAPGSEERVFEAFYTTKSQGLGMGLSISRSIMEAHGGRLWASANQPHGAVFRFSLQVSEETLS